MHLFLRLLRYFLILVVFGLVAGCLAHLASPIGCSRHACPVETLKEVRLQVPLRVYTADGKLVATFGETRSRSK